MPEQDSSGFADFALHLTQAAQRRTKKVVKDAERYDLGCDESGVRQYLIAMDVEGTREHYKTIKLPASDPQSAGNFTTVIAKIRDELASTFHRLLVQWPDDSEVVEAVAVEPTAADILSRLSTATGKLKASLICDAETLRLDQPQRDQLPVMLWNYILANRDSPDGDVLVAVGSAIRKYVAMLNVDRMGEIAALLDIGHRPPLRLDLELEVAKMIYRKFEANPPPQPDPQPALAERLWEMVQQYAAPRLILRGKFATVAALAIEAIVSMRSPLAEVAAETALNSDFRFFQTLVTNDLRRLRDRWRAKNTEAADWCDALLNQQAHS